MKTYYHTELVGSDLKVKPSLVLECISIVEASVFLQALSVLLGVSLHETSSVSPDLFSMALFSPTFSKSCKGEVSTSLPSMPKGKENLE